MPREELLAAFNRIYRNSTNLKLSPAGAASESHLPSFVSSASSTAAPFTAPSTGSTASFAVNDCVLPSKPAAQLNQAPYAHAVMWCAARRGGGLTSKNHVSNLCLSSFV